MRIRATTFACDGLQALYLIARRNDEGFRGERNTATRHEHIEKQNWGRTILLA